MDDNMTKRITPTVASNPVKVASDRLGALVESREAKQVQEAIRVSHGFEPSLDYCADLIAFVDTMTHLVDEAQRDSRK